MSETITIGIDHGYASMETAHFSYLTGLVEYEHEPYTSKDVLEYGSKYYVVGSGRQPLQKDKTVTEDYYLLTLAAIARELVYRGTEPTASVHLAAGLPLTSFGRDKKKFKECSSDFWRRGLRTPFMVRIPVRTKNYLPDEIDSCQPMTSLFEQSVLLIGDISQAHY